MAARVGIEVTCTKDGRVFDEDLDQYDAIAFYTNNDLTLPNSQKEPPMSADGKKRLLDAVAGGKGFMAFHSSCASWRTPKPAKGEPPKIDPYFAMLGGEFVAHGPQQESVMRVVSLKFPGMKKLGDQFKLREEWYALKNFAKDLHVILVQETDAMKGVCYQRPPFPSTWARNHEKGRVFFTSMAHREVTWIGQPFGQIVLGGLAWVLGNADGGGLCKTPMGFVVFATQGGDVATKGTAVRPRPSYHTIHWYNKYGFAHDWLTGWSDPTDTICWKANVVTTGRYKVRRAADEKLPAYSASS